MSIPDFQSIMRPLLEVAADGKEHTISEVTEELAQRFKLTAEEQAALLPSGRQATFRNRTAWAKTYLTQAGALESLRRSFFQITERGHRLLKDSSGRITVKELEQFPEFVQFRTPKHGKEETQSLENADKQTPEEMLESAYQRFRGELAAEVLSRVKKNSPAFFERLVVELLLKMGYGGSRRNAGEVIGRSGDEGIDGVINEDRLGLDVIYLQAKRWDGSVGRPEIHRFAGALQGKRAKKGVFITTGTFSADAREFVKHIESRVVLIDGEQLSELMIDWNVGVSPIDVYETKKIDPDYFDE